MKTIQGAEARIRDVAAVEEEAAETRNVATVEVVVAIRRLVELLRASLKGGKLRGCPNLTPDWGNRGPSTGSPGATAAYRGWRLRGDGTAPLDPATLAGGGRGRPALVLNEEGSLVWACREIDDSDHRSVVEGIPDEASFKSGDLLKLLELLEEAIPQHLAKAAAAKVPHVQARELGRLVVSMLTEAATRGIVAE